ncbi:MAG: hypothetical protein JWN46_842 [Acidimicrobiales bacterium]|nr:hypothetical protein [Acidimicrobiales bacterium]
MAEAHDRRRWVLFGAIAFGVALLLLLGAFLMTRPGERPTFLDTGSSATTSTTGATTGSTTAPSTTRCTPSTVTPATPLPRGHTSTTSLTSGSSTTSTTTTAVPATGCAN